MTATPWDQESGISIHKPMNPSAWCGELYGRNTLRTMGSLKRSDLTQ